MTTVDIVNLFIVLSLFLLVIGGAEFLYKRKLPADITRKVVHIGGGIVAALLPVFLDLKTVVIIGSGLFLILLWSKKKNFLNSVHKINEESIGALLYAPSLTLTAVVFWPINQLAFQGAALVLGLSDGVAGIVGKRYGKRKYSITGTKTIEGSIVFFLITALILLAILIVNSSQPIFSKMMFVFGGSLLLTIIEALFGKGWDNLFIPLVAGFLLLVAL
jgi:phytol kinase